MNSKTVPSATAVLSIYDGRHCIGFVLPRGKVGFEAFTSGERSRGLFPTQQDAIAVVGTQAEAGRP
jgi:hypothetical protein